MGGVMSCIKSAFRTIGNCLTSIVRSIGNILTAIVNGVVSFINIIISFLTCGYCGRRRTAATRTKHHTTRRSRV